MNTTGEIINLTTGLKLTTAIGPVERIKWLEQVVEDARLGDADVRFAIVLQSFVNRAQGFAFCGEKGLAEKTRIRERTVRLRLATLIECGHVFSQRRGRKPAALFLIFFDRQDASRSKRSVRVTLPATFQHFDRQESGTSTGKPRFSNAAKSDSCAPITQGVTQRITQGSAVASARASSARAAPSHVPQRTDSECAASDGSSLSRLTARELPSEEHIPFDPSPAGTENPKPKRCRIDYLALLARLDETWPNY